MDNIIAFDVSALLICVLIIAVNIRKKHLDMLQHRIFLNISLLCVIDTAVRIMGRYALSHSELYSSGYIYGMNYAAVSIECLIPIFFAGYCLSVYNSAAIGFSKRTKLMFLVPFAAELCMIVYSAPKHLLFDFDSDMKFVINYGAYVIALISAYFIAYSMYLSFNFKKAVENRITSANILAGTLILLGIISEAAIPNIMTPNLPAVFGLLIIQLMAERTEDYIDHVTEIPNGNAFRKCFEINKKTRYYNEVYILYVENIRLLNLTIGFSKVNTMLKAVAEFLEELTYQTVFYTELGTFEIMPKLTPTEKEMFFAKIKQRFSSVWETGGSEILVSVRLMEVKIPADADDVDKVYAYADFLRSSNNITSDIVYANTVALRDNSRILLVENCIKKAIENDGFKMYYQPIYSTAEKRIVSAEALIRLIDPQYGFISPAEFIPIAEENGSILQIGKSVLKQVFKFVSENDIEKMGLDYIEVNLSVVQCMQNNLADSIISLADTHEVDSRKINLEITETAAAERPIMLIKNMKMLVENSYSFSLDDFGTGYSNISSMVDMPLDIIKFDKSIIDRAKTSRDGKILLESLTAMVKKMGKRIVAEGVETEEQLHELEAMGIDYIQGFYFSKPLPSEKFIEFVNDFDVRSFVSA